MPYCNNTLLAAHEVFVHHFRLPKGARKWHILDIRYAFA